MKNYFFITLIILTFCSCKHVESVNAINDTPCKTVSGFFKFSGSYNGEKLPSFRLNINAKQDNSFSVNILTPFNSLVFSTFFDNTRFVILDMKEKVAYIDKTPPFTLKSILQIDADLRDLVSFFKGEYCNNIETSFNKVYKSGKIYTNKKGDIIILGNNGFKALLTPIGKLQKNKQLKLNFSINSNFKTIYVN
jgi:hypothetical protein